MTAVLWAGITGSVCASAAFAAIPVVDDCAEADYQDRTGETASRTLTWDFVFAGGGDRCIKIRVGQSVRWNGDFAAHPLDTDQGDTPNPIATPDSDGRVTFAQPGVFGFRCNYHFEMRGAVQVVPAPVAPTAVPWAAGAGRLGLLAMLLLAGVFATWWLARPRRP